nr:copper homeostasis protein CutC [Allomuricauda sp.]
MLVEVCANSLQSALRAQHAGADRIELCSELGVGGITPSLGLIELVVKHLDIPVHVLIRPRGGHFTYSDTELEVMKKDIAYCKKLGVHGIVSGILGPDGTLDVDTTAELIEISSPMKFIFHRAFDWVSHPAETYRQLNGLGVDGVLTSGQQSSAVDGLPLLTELLGMDLGTMVMAGGGINEGNAQKFKEAGLKAIHLSGTNFENEVHLDGKLSMNSDKHLKEHWVAVTNTDKVRQVIRSVK